MSSALAHGNLDVRTGETTPDEIGQLGANFDQMANVLNQQVVELRHLAEENSSLLLAAEKAIRAQELIDAIRRAARGLRTLDPLAADALMNSLVWTDKLAELTSRELEVLRVVACGRSNTQIAHTLKISEATVRSHLANILSKLCLRDRSQITPFALKRGLVSLDEIE